MIFISSGHAALSKKNYDPGAVNKKGLKEGDLTIELKRLVQHQLDLLGAKYTSDNEEESLAQWLKRAVTGPASVVLEIHFDSASAAATGSTVIVGNDGDRMDKAFAKELVDATASILGIKNRGVITEGQSARGKLGLMREQGIVALVEVAFISNDNDLKAFHLMKNDLAKAYAEILVKYEKLV